MRIGKRDDNSSADVAICTSGRCIQYSAKSGLYASRDIAAVITASSDKHDLGTTRLYVTVSASRHEREGADQILYTAVSVPVLPRALRVSPAALMLHGRL